MSLTSYRAAPPRVDGARSSVAAGRGESLWGCGRGGALLFRTLRCSTIGAEGFHGRVRDGIGCLAPRYGHQAGKACPRRACPWQKQGRGVSCGGGGGGVGGGGAPPGGG